MRTVRPMYCTCTVFSFLYLYNLGKSFSLYLLQTTGLSIPENVTLIPMNTPPKSEQKIATNLTTTKPTRANLPRIIFHMHVPKTGGRSFRLLLGSWLNDRETVNCLVAPCCTSWDDYIASVHASFHTDNLTCAMLSREISVSGIQTTQNIVKLNHEWWYKATLFRNPISRFVSAVRHNLRQGRCRTMDIHRAVQMKLNGDCKVVDHDREQVSYYLDSNFSINNPFVPPHNLTLRWRDTMNNNHVNKTTNNGDEMARTLWTRYLSPFEFVGITDYMDASRCVLGLELAQLNAMNLSFALPNACYSNRQFRLQSSLPTDAPLDALTTTQVLKIITLWNPLDVMMYPYVLQSFQRKLSKVLLDQPFLSYKYGDNLTSIKQEMKVWTKVAHWQRDYINYKNMSLFFWQLHKLENDEKEILAPGLRWR